MGVFKASVGTKVDIADATEIEVGSKSASLASIGGSIGRLDSITILLDIGLLDTARERRIAANLTRLDARSDGELLMSVVDGLSSRSMMGVLKVLKRLTGRVDLIILL